MHPAKLGAGLDPVLAAPPSLGGRLTLPWQPAQPLHACGPSPPWRRRLRLHDGSHRGGSRQHWGGRRLPPCGYAVQDRIATGIEGLDQCRIGIRPQRHRGGITLVGDEGPERAMLLYRGENQGMGRPQHQAALVGLHGQAVDLATPALQIGPDLGGSAVVLAVSRVCSTSSRVSPVRLARQRAAAVRRYTRGPAVGQTNSLKRARVASKAAVSSPGRGTTVSVPRPGR